MEIHSFVADPLPSPTYQENADSTKFNFDNEYIGYVMVIQWVTGVSNCLPCQYYLRYSSNLVVTNANRFTFSFQSTTTIISGMKVNLFFFALSIKGYRIFFTSGHSMTGASHVGSFSTNFGVDSNQYGNPLTGHHCINALDYIVIDRVLTSGSIASLLLDINVNGDIVSWNHTNIDFL